MSSATARASRNNRSCEKPFGPTRAKTPSRNAVSVEITTPHAPAAGPDGLIARNTSAGSTRPASAAATGTAARRRSDSSPTTTSRLTSRPKTKKKNTISPSLTQWCRSSAKLVPPKVMVSGVCQNSS